MSEPPEHARVAAQADLARIARTTALVSTACIGVAVLGAVAAIAGLPPQVALLLLLLAAGGVTFGALFGIAWRRAGAAKRALTASTPLAANCAGWCRPPDGCNYAVFFTAEERTPDLVVRLPLRREMVSSTQGWLYGSAKPSLVGGVALVGPNGLLATGRVVPKRSARKKWARRTTEPAWWVQRPPENWLPPGGE